MTHLTLQTSFFFKKREAPVRILNNFVIQIASKSDAGKNTYEAYLLKQVDGQPKFFLGRWAYINSLIFVVRIVSNLESKIIGISIHYGEDHEEEKQHKSFKSSTQIKRQVKRMTRGRHVKTMRSCDGAFDTCTMGDVKRGG